MKGEVSQTLHPPMPQACLRALERGFRHSVSLQSVPFPFPGWAFCVDEELERGDCHDLLFYVMRESLESFLSH